MRARNIKPGFFKNEDLAEVSHTARLLFVGLWCMADRAGRLEDRPKRIKAEIFPYESVDVPNLLVELEVRGFIHRYGQDPPCIWIPTFHRHQNPHKNEKDSELPAYSDFEKLPEQYGTSTEPLGLIPSSLNHESLLLEDGSKEPVENFSERARDIDTLTPAENLRRRGGHKSDLEPIGGAMEQMGAGIGGSMA